MFLDIISESAYGRFNRKLATLTNLMTACYWSELLSIIGRVVKKNKFTSEGYFRLDRNYMLHQTTLTAEQQHECELALSKLGVLQVHETDPDLLGVFCEQMVKILIDDNETDLKKIAKAAKVDRTTKAEGKKAGIINRLFSRVKESDPELLELYRKLIEACYAKGMQTNAQIDLFQEELNKYTADKSVKKELLMIGVSRGYKVFEWCSSVYEKDHKVSAVRPQGEQKVATELNEDIKF